MFAVELPFPPRTGGGVFWFWNHMRQWLDITVDADGIRRTVASPQVAEWMVEQQITYEIEDNTKAYSFRFIFNTEEDAIKFKLRWL